MISVFSFIFLFFFFTNCKKYEERIAYTNDDCDGKASYKHYTPNSKCLPAPCVQTTGEQKSSHTLKCPDEVVYPQKDFWGLVEFHDEKRTRNCSDETTEQAYFVSRGTGTEDDGACFPLSQFGALLIHCDQKKIAQIRICDDCKGRGCGNPRQYKTEGVCEPVCNFVANLSDCSDSEYNSTYISFDLCGNNGDDKWSGGWIALMIVGVLVVVGMIIVAIYVLLWHKKKASSEYSRIN